MAKTSIHKVNSSSSPKGKMGQKYLACGISIAMRLWESLPVGTNNTRRKRDYETAGYVIEGRAELRLGNQTLILEAGDSWIVPRGAEHSYRILEAFTAIEMTYPPAVIKRSDEEIR
jgi:quercetin dioxygenase-like cupin family protein